LHEEVLLLTAALRRLGVDRGDRVALHLGWVPEAVVAMLACARLGAEFTVVPVSLPVEALSLRLADFGPRVLFTQDGGWRHGTILPLKNRADEAIEATSGIQHTVVVRRTGMQVEWFEGDRWYDELQAAADPSEGHPTPVPSQHPLVSVHLANHRGRPVAVRLGTANLAAVALANHRFVMAEGDVFWGAADVSWLGAQSHGIVGPLLAGCSAVMYEGTLDVPAPERAWQIVERYGVTSLLTSPSIVRALRGWSLTAPAGTTSLRRVMTIGDRLEPDLREWLAGVLDDRVTLADGWGQIELGGIVVCDAPIDRARMPDPGFAILAPDGSPVSDGQAGEWVMLRPWAGMMRGVDTPGADPTAYHWERHPGSYATGDLARRTPTGEVEFLGRLDTVITVSGQLVSLNEVRDVLLDQPFVVDADAFESTESRLGRVVGAAVVLEEGLTGDPTVLRELQDAVRELLGGLSRPRTILVLDRIGYELDTPVRHRVLSGVATAADTESVTLTWDQVLAAAPGGGDR
ncbi:acyl-CoA synthetase, partial [Nocardioides sp.]|uniref:acyl-CoA synthetase n=1 Tax=Nocardioides sp. TaxID=35761 RepID=UPI002736C47D